jgi:transglutaminase-like putative cysteine protease
MIDAIRALDSRPLDQARPPDRRIVGNCRQFATLACALLRGAGAPARARCGFASYFERGKWIDHWIVESWDGERWIRFDPQLDEFQRESLAIDFDTSRLTLERFLPGLSAWNRYRDGEEDPDRFGILDMWGAWFIRGNAVRDFAALNKVELLPWDTWGLMGREDEDDWVDAAAIGDAFFKLRGLYESCDLLRVPTEIWSARFGRRVTLAL